MAYDVDVVCTHCYVCSDIVRAHPVLVICSRMSDCVVKVGRHDVDIILSLNLKELELIEARLMS